MLIWVGGGEQRLSILGGFYPGRCCSLLGFIGSASLTGAHQIRYHSSNFDEFLGELCHPVINSCNMKPCYAN